MKNLRYLREFDWFASIISLHLPLLRQFHFHLPIFRSKRLNKLIDENTFTELRQHFKIMHKDQYQSRLIIDRKNLKHLFYESFDSSDSSD